MEILEVFSKRGDAAVRKIVREELHLTKTNIIFLDYLKARRRYTRLAGHEKVARERKCMCGSVMHCCKSSIKSGGWYCGKEEKEWDWIFYKLKATII